MATFLSNTAVSVHATAKTPNTKTNRPNVCPYCMDYWFDDPPDGCDPPGLPRRLLPRKRLFDFGLLSPAGVSPLFVGASPFLAADSPPARAAFSGLGPGRRPSGFRLPLPRRFFLLRSSKRVRLSWPTTFS